MPLSTMLEHLGLRPAPTPSGDAADARMAELTRAVTGIAESVAALQRQQDALQDDVRAARETLATVTRRAAQVRAVMRRDAEQDGALERLERLLADPHITAHVRRAIAAAPLRLHPFPHAVVDGLLPPDLYDALLDGIPPEELFADEPFNKQELHIPLVVGPAWAVRVWRFIATVVAKRDITPAVLEKFEQPVTEWVHRHWPDVEWSALEKKTSGGRLMLRGRGYRIPPHRDPKWGFITCLMYLARPGDSEQWGTRFYTVEQDDEARGAKPHWIDPARCRLVEDVAFRPNRLLVFVNSEGAHGAEIADDAPDDLRRFTFQFRIGPAAPAMAHLLSRLPEDKRDYWAGKLRE